MEFLYPYEGSGADTEILLNLEATAKILDECLRFRKSQAECGIILQNNLPMLYSTIIDVWQREEKEKEEFGEEIVRDRKPLSKKAVMREVGELAVFYGSAKEEGAQGFKVSYVKLSPVIAAWKLDE